MTGGVGRRARTMEELGANFAALAEGDTPNYRPIEPQPDDVYITSWGKSGTTMMQQMFHQLRMGAATGRGDMDFEDISSMTPWEDAAPIIDHDMNVPQKAAPRGFKSHREYERLPSGCRYVVGLRDPKETFVSFHRFYDGWLLERGAVSMEEYFPIWMEGGPGGCDYFTHLLSWYARRDEPDTLLTTYRWIVSNRRAMIERLAAFCDIALTPELADMVEEMTSRDFMRANKDHFSDVLVCGAFEAKLGIPASGDSAKVQAVGSDAKQLPASVVERIDAMWAERVAPVTGHADFASLAAELDERMTR